MRERTGWCWVDAGAMMREFRTTSFIRLSASPASCEIIISVVVSSDSHFLLLLPLVQLAKLPTPLQHAQHRFLDSHNCHLVPFCRQKPQREVVRVERGRCRGEEVGEAFERESEWAQGAARAVEEEELEGVGRRKGVEDEVEEGDECGKSLKRGVVDFAGSQVRREERGELVEKEGQGTSEGDERKEGGEPDEERGEDGKSERCIECGSREAQEEMRELAGEVSVMPIGGRSSSTTRTCSTSPSSVRSSGSSAVEPFPPFRFFPLVFMRPVPFTSSSVFGFSASGRLATSGMIQSKMVPNCSQLIPALPSAEFSSSSCSTPSRASSTAPT